MSKYKASLHNYMFNSINAIVMIVNGIIMVPIYFKFMSVSDYGAWLATGNIVAMLGLVESGFAGVITQKMSIALANNDGKKFLQLASANIYTALIMAMALLLLGLSIFPFIADWINAEESIKKAITIAYVISLFSAVISLLVSLFGAFPQVWQNTKTIGIINTVVNIIAIVSLVIYLYAGFGVVSLALGYITRSSLNLIGQGAWIIREWRKRELSLPLFNFSVTKDLLRDCMYPFLSKISDVIMGSSQSFIIALFINPTLAAVYDISSKITVVACNFVSMANGSFFALFSLTFASQNKQEINRLLKNVSLFFLTTLFSVLLFSLVFSESIIHFWVGLDKYGGNLLVLFIVIAILITQLKQYFNNLLYTGGLINKSAKLDMLNMLVFVVMLLLIIKPAQIYAIPLAGIISGAIFIGLYLLLLKNKLNVDTAIILRLCLKLFLISLPFALFHFLLKINLFTINAFIIYALLFTTIYCGVIAFTNKPFVTALVSKLGYGKK
jgi:O-antigen/teichoic acid export membrane protein